MLFRPLEGTTLTVGANPECDLCLPVEGVAPVHAVLRRDGTGIYVTNKAAAGTGVNEESVTDERKLADGDRLGFAGIVARLRLQSDEESHGRTRTLELGSSQVEPSFFLTVPDIYPGRRFVIDTRGVAVGGDPTNDVVIADPFVSSFHARFVLEGNRCFVRDLNSRNGVFVGEQKLREGEVRPGLPVRLGKTQVMVSTAAQGHDAGVQLVGKSEEIVRLRELVGRVAVTEAPVLVLGDTGTGKEVVARLIAERSRRRDKAFVAINCGSLSKTLIESELFGHERGAFTGAVGLKQGAFEAAHRGTLFLDEIGELPLDLQPQLLRVLETGEIRRVGSTQTFRVDVRLVAATNRDLAIEVQAGRFREDLYHRLHVVAVRLPSLSERAGDVTVLATHFLNHFAPPEEGVSLSAEAMTRLVNHTWPGNVRELRNVLQRAVLLRRGNVIEATDITFPASTLTSRVQTASATSSRTLFEIERDAIVAELRRHGGGKREAADALGVSRSTIHRKIEEYGIDVDAVLKQ